MGEADSLIKVLDLFQEPLCLVDSELRGVFLNSAFSTLVGLPPSSSFSLSDLCPEFNSKQIRFGQHSLSIAKSDGNCFRVKALLHKIEDNLLLFRILAYGQDLSTPEGFRAHRMETLGTLAGGIAHDVNNILTGILGHTSYLLATLPKSGPHLESLSAIEEGAKKSAAMTRQILNFSKVNSDQAVSKINISDLVESTCNLIRGAVPRNCKLCFEVPGQPIYVKMVEGQLSQVLINLITNARDALGAEGEILILVKEVKVGSDNSTSQSLRESGLLKGAYVCLTVRDNGEGISQDIMQRVFEPYFSTKSDKGTGLGLATVQTIVKESGGCIEISSELGQGTTVSVYLPIADRNEHKQSDDDLPYAKGEEKVLIVDDDSSVRNVLKLSLKRLGYKVETASNGKEAISKFEQSQSKFDLVVLDMLMPEQSGRDVFFALKEIDADLKVLICSAYSSEATIDEIMQHGGKGVISKPFTIEELADKVRFCLDA